MTIPKKRIPRLLASIIGLTVASTCAYSATIITPDNATRINAPGLSGRDINQTINDSGFNTTAANIEDWYHDQNKSSDGNFYYIGDRNSQDYSTVEFIFTFNSEVDVDTVHFWTYDRVGDSPGREIKDFDISFSTDNGGSYSTPISLTNWLDRSGARIDIDPSPGTISKIGHQSRSFSMQTGVTDIKFSNIVTHNATERYVAFSEVKFSAVPEPSTVLLGGIGGLFLLRRRR